MFGQAAAAATRKHCHKCFNRNFALYSEKDKFCDFCNNKFIKSALTPESKIVDETKFILDACYEEIIDHKNPWFADLTDLHMEHVSKGVYKHKGKK